MSKRRKNSRRRPDEILFKNEHPFDGQRIAFRKYCHRRYYIATYEGSTQSVRVGSFSYRGDMLGGWLPLDRIKSTDL